MKRSLASILLGLATFFCSHATPAYAQGDEADWKWSVRCPLASCSFWETMQGNISIVPLAAEKVAAEVVNEVAQRAASAPITATCPAENGCYPPTYIGQVNEIVSAPRKAVNEISECEYECYGSARHEVNIPQAAIQDDYECYLDSKRQAEDELAEYEADFDCYADVYDLPSDENIAADDLPNDEHIAADDLPNDEYITADIDDAQEVVADAGGLRVIASDAYPCMQDRTGDQAAFRFLYRQMGSVLAERRGDWTDLECALDAAAYRIRGAMIDGVRVLSILEVEALDIAIVEMPALVDIDTTVDVSECTPIRCPGVDVTIDYERIVADQYFARYGRPIFDGDHPSDLPADQRIEDDLADIADEDELVADVAQIAPVVAAEIDADATAGDQAAMDVAASPFRALSRAVLNAVSVALETANESIKQR